MIIESRLNFDIGYFQGLLVYQLLLQFPVPIQTLPSIADNQSTTPSDGLL